MPCRRGNLKQKISIKQNANSKCEGINFMIYSGLRTYEDYQPTIYPPWQRAPPAANHLPSLAEGATGSQPVTLPGRGHHRQPTIYPPRQRAPPAANQLPSPAEGATSSQPVTLPGRGRHQQPTIYPPWQRAQPAANHLPSLAEGATGSQPFTLPGRGRHRQPTAIDPTLDLCTRYPLQLGGLRQCGIRSLPNTCTHDQDWESIPRPSDLVQCPIHWPHSPSTPRL